ncbi:hypothetical protein HCU40_11480 [Pseudanabaena biceps]|nr:hypothetical protein [Pseudanabaena biceps]
MAYVLSNQENMGFFITIAIVAASFSVFAIALFTLFKRLRKLENFVYRRKKSLKPRFVSKPSTKVRTKTKVNTVIAPHSSSYNPVKINQPKTQPRSPQTQVYSKPSYSPPYSKSIKKSPYRVTRSASRVWWLAIAMAIIMGVAIALAPTSSILTNPDYLTAILMLVGLGLVIGAAYAV